MNCERDKIKEAVYKGPRTDCETVRRWDSSHKRETFGHCEKLNPCSIITWIGNKIEISRKYILVQPMEHCIFGQKVSQQSQASKV